MSEYERGFFMGLGIVSLVWTLLIASYTVGKDSGREEERNRDTSTPADAQEKE